MRVFCGIRRIRARGYSEDTRKGSCNGMRMGMQKIRAMVRGFVQRHAQMCAAVCRDYDMCR